MAESKKEIIQETILKAMENVNGQIDQDSTNEQQKFTYTSYNNAMKHVRKACVDAGLIFIPLGIENAQVDRTAKGHFLASGNFKFTIANKFGESCEAAIYASGFDTLDKFSYKICSGAKKYLIIQLFGLSNDMDPENDKQESVEPPNKDVLAINKKITGAKTQEELQKVYKEFEHIIKFNKTLSDEVKDKLEELKGDK